MNESILRNTDTESLTIVRDRINEELERRERLEEVGIELIEKLNEYLMLGGAIYRFDNRVVMDIDSDLDVTPDPNHYNRINIREY